MRYVIRSVKYFILLCVLYVALEWLMLTFAPDAAIEGLTLGELLTLRLETDRGMLLVAAFVGLAAFYPLFGFMKMRVENSDYNRDTLRLNNAMHTYGFKFTEERGNVKIYRAEGILRRITLLFEDEIEVHNADGGIELRGMRRTVARVGYQLQAYLYNSRFDNDQEDKE
jgi:hypothetical protein